ncbi:MAG: general secretion pathway protein GspB [Dokdonella sp.]
MSLILEALKKSERQRQIGTAPTLATPPMSRKRKRSILPWLVLAIVIAAVAGWWLMREDMPDSVPPAEVQDAVPAPALAPVAATAKKPEVPMTTVAPPPPTVAVSPVAAPAPISADKQVAEAAAAMKAAAPPGSQLPPAKPPTTKPQTAMPPAAQLPAGQPPAATEPVAVPPPSVTASLPKLWELPYEKRKDIPALAMSLQVYAADPSQRFAIINDERHVEGDDLGDGLKLQEITPDGLIVEYRGERFLFPRGGR